VFFIVGGTGDRQRVAGGESVILGCPQENCAGPRCAASHGRPHSKGRDANAIFWCTNLDADWTGAVAEVGPGTARVGRLYMAGSRLGFDRNHIDLHLLGLL
jgi:hypothetical protein